MRAGDNLMYSYYMYLIFCRPYAILGPSGVHTGHNLSTVLGGTLEAAHITGQCGHGGHAPPRDQRNLLIWRGLRHQNESPSQYMGMQRRQPQPRGSIYPFPVP